MWDVAWKGLLAGYGIAIPVGAIAVLIVNTAIRCGFACGWAAGAGAATADLLYATVAVAAGAAASGFLEEWSGPIRLISGVVLLAFAIRGVVTALRPSPPVEAVVTARSGELVRTYGRFLGLTMVNPLTVVYFGTVVIGATAGRRLTPAEGGVFVGAAFAASLSWQTALAAVGAAARRGLPPAFRTAAAVIGNLFVAAIALTILL